LQTQFKPIIVNFIRKLKEKEEDSENDSDDEEKLVKSN